MENKKHPMAEAIRKILDGADSIGITSSPSTTLEIALDVLEDSKHARALGQMVFVMLDESGRKILSIGQIVEIKTKNRWHEDMSFKGVIKRYGKLPHLSEAADNRLANISVQSSFDISASEPGVHILGTSPSTGLIVYKMNDEIIDKLVEHQKNNLTYIGHVYGSDVNMPMWFKHFGEKNNGAGDAYHIGVFGKTGSGKTVTSSCILLGYARNKNSNMSILVLDPQSQFSNDQNLLPRSGDEYTKLGDSVKKLGMNYEKINLIEDVYLPQDNSELLGDLLVNYGFTKKLDPFYDSEKEERMKESIIDYIEGRLKKSSFDFTANPKDLLMKMLKHFIEEEKYIEKVYSSKHSAAERLRGKIQYWIDEIDGGGGDDCINKWTEVINLFSSKGKTSVKELIEKIVSPNQQRNFVVLKLQSPLSTRTNENLAALFLRVIEEEIVCVGDDLYGQGRKANCLIVMDEAHRYVNKKSSDKRIQELTREIIDAVRTTRKYGIGHMFITQSLESIDDEILKQMRIFAFGYGLTTGSEMKKIKETINNLAAEALYKSFIDPTSNKKFPFMFFGPVSPFSATGAPLFVEIYTDYEKFAQKNL